MLLKQGGTKLNSEEQYRNEDEIDLAELVGVLFRRWKTTFTILIVMFLLSIVYCVTQTNNIYTASTMIEIGEFFQDGEQQTVESLPAFKNRVLSHAKSLSRDFKGNGKDNKLMFSIDEDLDVLLPEGGNIVDVRIQAPKDSRTIHFLELINKRVISDHSRTFAEKELSLKNSIKKQDLKIKSIKNKISKTKRQFQLKEITLNSNIKDIKSTIKKLNNQIDKTKRQYELEKISLRNNISNLNSTISKLENKKHRIRNTISLLSDKKEDLKKRLEKGKQTRDNVLQLDNDNFKNPSSDTALSFLLFNDRQMQIQKYIDKLYNQVSFKIPKRISKLKDEIVSTELDIQEKDSLLREVRTKLKQLDSNLESDIEALKAKISNKKYSLREAKTKLEQLDSNLESEIEDLKYNITSNKLQISQLNSQLDNMLKTSVIAKPQFSNNPVGATSKKMIVAIGLVLGLFLGVFAAFLREFWVTNRDKILGRENH